MAREAAADDGLVLRRIDRNAEAVAVEHTGEHIHDHRHAVALVAQRQENAAEGLQGIGRAAPSIASAQSSGTGSPFFHVDEQLAARTRLVAMSSRIGRCFSAGSATAAMGFVPSRFPRRRTARRTRRNWSSRSRSCRAFQPSWRNSPPCRSGCRCAGRHSRHRTVPPFQWRVPWPLSPQPDQRPSCASMSAVAPWFLTISGTAFASYRPEMSFPYRVESV